MTAETRSSTPRSSESGNNDRLTAFMERHELQTSTDLGQVFRVGQTTCAKWLRLARDQKDGDSLEQVLQGPALILLELMEEGIQTSDLLAMKALAAARQRPKEITDLKWEASWSLVVPDYARRGVLITAKTGHFMTVHSGWFKDRITQLTVKGDENPDPLIQMLLKRYRSALTKMAELPR